MFQYIIRLKRELFYVELSMEWFSTRLSRVTNVKNKEIHMIINILFSLILAFTFGQQIDLENNSLSVPTDQIQQIQVDNPQKKMEELYQKLDLQDKMSFYTFERAYKGYQTHSSWNVEVLSIVDFTKPSTEKRLFVIDLKNETLLFSTFVAHGKFSGENKTNEYSNVPQSKKSSLGFYKTAETYSGKHGYSLRLDGLEPNINDNARARAIVMHGAAYVSEAFIASHGRLGRSWGCPAVSEELSTPIINTIKDGSCLYIHDDNQQYLSQSHF